MSAGVASITLIFLVLGLFAGNPYFFGIYNYDVISGIDMWCIDRLGLSHEYWSDFSGKPAEDGAIGIDNAPFLRDRAFFSKKRFHIINCSRILFSENEALYQPEKSCQWFFGAKNRPGKKTPGRFPIKIGIFPLSAGISIEPPVQEIT